MKENEDDIFKEAAIEALDLKSSIKVDGETAVQNFEVVEENSVETIYDAAAEIIDNDVDWTNLIRDMNGKHAKRFNQILGTLSDREFMKNYLKSLEYFKPKMVRQDLKFDDTVDRTININVVQINKEGNINIVKIGNNDIEE